MRLFRNMTRKRAAIVMAGAVVLVSGVFAANVMMPLPVEPNAAIPVPVDREGVRIYRMAMRARGPKIMVSTEKKWLWLISAKNDTLISAQIAIGMGNTFSFKGRKYEFSTPRGKRTVLGKSDKPVWTVPEWHYYEKAAERGYEVVELRQGIPYLLKDSTTIEIRDGQVGRVNRFGNWHPFSQDFEIMFENKVFMPPINTLQRKVTDALGPYKLDMGDGYLIHGTHVDNEQSIGTAASHGCVRMRNSDLTELYPLVETGTKIYIF
jgi:hypothetical protein